MATLMRSSLLLTSICVFSMHGMHTSSTQVKESAEKNKTALGAAGIVAAGVGGAIAYYFELPKIFAVSAGCAIAYTVYESMQANSSLAKDLKALQEAKQELKKENDQTRIALKQLEESQEKTSTQVQAAQNNIDQLGQAAAVVSTQVATLADVVTTLYKTHEIANDIEVSKKLVVRNHTNCNAIEKYARDTNDVFAGICESNLPQIETTFEKRADEFVLLLSSGKNNATKNNTHACINQYQQEIRLASGHVSENVAAACAEQQVQINETLNKSRESIFLALQSVTK